MLHYEAPPWGASNEYPQYMFLCNDDELVFDVLSTLFNPSCWTRKCPAFANSVDPDQLASAEANWSGSALVAIKYVHLYQQSGSSNLIGRKLEMGVAS